MDVRMFTVGPVAENSFIFRRDGSDRALIVDPGDEADKLLGAIDGAGRDARRDPAHPHALRPRGRGGPRGAGPPAPRCGCRGSRASCWPTSTASCPGRASARSSPTRPSTCWRAASGSSWPASRSTCSSRPGHSPGHVTFSIPDEAAVFSGDVLFQGSVGRTDLPGGDWGTLLESIRLLVDSLPPETAVYPGHMGITTLGAERASNPFLAELAQVAVAAKLQAPRGTFDVLPADGRRRAALARTTDDAARPRRLRAVRDAGVRGHRAVRARGGGGHRHRPQGDVHLRGQGRPLADAAPRGHRGRLPRVRRARHAQAAAAGEAALLGPVLPPRGAAGGPLPPVHPARAPRRSAPTTPRSTPRSCCCSWSSLEAVGARDLRVRLSSLGTPETREAYLGGAGRLPARARVRAVRRRARPARHQPAARVRLRPPGHPRRDGGRRRGCSTGSGPDDAEHFADGARPARRRRARLRGRHRARARARLLHAHGVRGRVGRARARRTRSAAAGATTGWWSSSAGPSTPGVGFAAGVERILLAAEVGGRGRPAAACSWRVAEPDAAALRLRARAAAARARPARGAGAGRPLAQGPAEAGRPHRRAGDRDRGRRHRGQGHGHGRADRRPPAPDEALALVESALAS